MRATLATLSALVLIGLLATWLWFSFFERQEVVFHGFVRGDLVFVGTEEAGRIADLRVTAGQEIRSDQLLFVLDSTLEKAARDEAAAALSEARARLARALAARELPEEVEILKARERKAQAALRFSQRELNRTEDESGSRRDKARAQRDSDQASLDEVRRQIAVAGMSARAEEIEAARAVVAAMEARLAAAQTRSAAGEGAIRRHSSRGLFPKWGNHPARTPGRIAAPARKRNHPLFCRRGFATDTRSQQYPDCTLRRL
jgi:multidrug resistance efflux pump